VTPVCSTSRSGFCTGMHPITIGAHQHRTLAEHKKPLPEGVKAVTDWFRGAGYWTANIKSMGGKRYGTGKVDWDFAYDGKPFDGAEWDDLKSHQPFYAQVNFSQSHRGWGAPKKADPAKVVLPSYYPNHPEARADWAAYLDEITEVDGLIAQALAHLNL
jgi:N-sulfoglucosamine sulfohydrolase